MKTALLGGSFNPPHLAHLLAAGLVLGEPDCAEARLVPCAAHPFGKDLIAFEERVALCGLLIAPFEGRLSVCEIEKELGQPSYTVRTLEALKKREPERSFAWVIGADNVPELHQWKDVQALFEAAEIWVVGRKGSPVAFGTQPASGPRVRWVGESPLPDISSTQVRERLGRGEPVRGLVPDAVADRIAERGLFAASL